MNSNEKKLKALVTVALLSLGGVAQAKGDASFIPMEELNAKERSFYEPQLKALGDIAIIDWSSVVAGVDEGGKLILRDRKSYEMSAIGAPSCWPDYTK